jgi:hypothetical protein
MRSVSVTGAGGWDMVVRIADARETAPLLNVR